MKRALVLGCFASFACSGQAVPSGRDEPLLVRYGTQNAQFIAGALPGSRPLTSAETLANVLPDPPLVTLNGGGGVVRQADTGFSLSGTSSKEGVAVGIRFLDLGSGYWVLPIPARDSVFPDTYIWSASLDFGAEIPPGRHPLAVVAIDAAGHGGTQASADVCVASDIPDNLSACSASASPPASVLSLVWDAAVDLDLRVLTPSGKIVDPKHPSTAIGDNGKFDPTLPGTGIFDTDALRGCRDTGHRRENLVWQKAPAPGRYLVYVSLYDACAASSVRFTVSVHQPRVVESAGRLQLTSTFERTGELLASDADAGTKLGLFVTQFVVQ